MTNAEQQAIQDMMDDGFIILEDDEFAFQEDWVDAECELSDLIGSGRSLTVNKFA